MLKSTYYKSILLPLIVEAFLLLKVADFFKLSFSRILFLVFLLHPSNVISVSWMIQLKTLMCFLFAIISFLFLIKAHNNKRWYLPSWTFFLFSLLSKSASLPLSVVFFFFSYKKELEVGKMYDIYGTVKGHRDNTTQLNRVKVIV